MSSLHLSVLYSIGMFLILEYALRGILSVLMDNCKLYKRNKSRTGVPARLITYLLVHNAVKENKEANYKKEQNSDFPFFSRLIDEVSHTGLLSNNWAFLGH